MKALYWRCIKQLLLKANMFNPRGKEMKKSAMTVLVAVPGTGGNKRL